MAETEPKRFILTNTQVSEGFAAAGCALAQSALFAGLPAASGRLPDLLAGEEGALDPAARLLFETLAAAIVSLRFLDFAEGSGIGIETRLLGSGDETYVALARPDADYWDFALLPGRAATLALIDELTGASARPGLDEDFALTLTMPALAIITATAQLVRTSELAAQFEGGVPGIEFLTEPVPMQFVEAAIAKERERPDPGSPVSRLALTCGGALFDVLDGGGLRRGLDDLRQAALVDADDLLTADGLALMALLKSRNAMSLVESARRAKKGVVLDMLLLLHGRDSLLTGAWRLDDQGKHAGLALSAMPGGELLKLVDGLLKPLDQPRSSKKASRKAKEAVCAQCGVPHDRGQKFCRQCGAKL